MIDNTLKHFDATEILGKSSIDTYFELYFILALSRVTKRYGYILDITNVSVDPYTMGTNIKNHFKELAFMGSIFIGKEVSDPELAEPTEFLTDISELEEISDDEWYAWEGKNRVWSKKYAEDNYKKINKNGQMEALKFNKIDSLGENIMVLVAKFLFLKHLQIEDGEKLVIDISNPIETANFRWYINILGCAKTLKIFKDLIRVKLYNNTVPMDEEFLLFNIAREGAGRNRYFSLSEKLDLIESMGIKEGQIMTLYQRRKISESNKRGGIETAYIMRIDEITENMIFFSSVGIPNTKEELRRAYDNISEEVRHKYDDLLTKKPHISIKSFEINDIGIHDFFLDEEYFLMPLSSDDIISKLVTIDGEVKEVPMNEINCVYWLLRQYEVEFDYELFKDTYNDGEDLLYDFYYDE